MVPSSSSPFGRRAVAAALACALATGSAPTTFAQPAPAPKAATPAPKAATPAPAPKPAKPAPKAGRPAASASADPGAEPPELIEGTDEVQRLYMDGDAALRRLAFTEAELLFTKAWSLSRSFDVAAKLGETKVEMGKYREAAQYLSFAIRNALPSTRPRRRERIKTLLDEAKQKLATVKLSASVVEATLAIDGVALDPIFIGPEIHVDPGKHTFEALAPGFDPARSEVETKAGEIYVVTLTLERAKPKGVPTAPPPPQGTPLPAALMGGGGGIALIAGAVLVGLAESKKTEAYDLARNTLTPDGKPTCPRNGPGPTERCDQVRAAAADADAFGNTAIGMFVGAGALLAGATVYMLFIRDDAPPASEQGKPPSPTARILPAVGANGGGLLLQGSF